MTGVGGMEFGIGDWTTCVDGRLLLLIDVETEEVPLVEAVVGLQAVQALGMAMVAKLVEVVGVVASMCEQRNGQGIEAGEELTFSDGWKSSVLWMVVEPKVSVASRSMNRS